MYSVSLTHAYNIGIQRRLSIGYVLEYFVPLTVTSSEFKTWLFRYLHLEGY